MGFGEGSAGGQGQEGGWGDGQVQTSAVPRLLCDFGPLTFLLGAHFPHLNSGGEEELISVCLCPRGPSSRGPLGPRDPRQDCPETELQPWQWSQRSSCLSEAPSTRWCLRPSGTKCPAPSAARSQAHASLEKGVAPLLAQASLTDPSLECGSFLDIYAVMSPRKASYPHAEYQWVEFPSKTD